MADRNEIFRIILEGRDKLSKELDTVRRASDKLDQSLQKLKKNKPDEFPLFGGGKASRGPGGQFIKKEEIAALDKVRQKIDDINRSINVLKRNRLKEGEFALFGGGRAVKGDDGRFIRVQDVTLLEKAKNRLDAIDKALIRIRTRARRGPLVEGEEAGAGATRLVRTATGQFTRAQDLTFVRRLGREFAALGRTIGEIQQDTRQGLFLGARRTIDELRRVADFAERVKDRIGDALTGGAHPTRTGVDPNTGRFISVSNINDFQKFVRIVQAGGQKIVETNEKIAASTKKAREDIKQGFRTGFDISRDTKRFIDERVKNTREEIAIEKQAIREKQEEQKLALSAENDRERKALFEKLENQREADAEEIEDLRAHIRELGRTEEDEEEKRAARREIRRIQRARRLRESEEKAALTAVFQGKRAEQRLEFAGQLRAVDSPDVSEIEKRALEERALAIERVEGSLKRMGARAGLAFGDIVRGAESARAGVRDMDRDIRLVNNSFTRFGFAIGSIFKNFGQLVNLRWLFLTGILSTFLTILVQVGTALVAVAASAVQAGAALGGAFLAGAAQALPVVGLLAAALSSFNKVLDQVKLNEKLDLKVKDNVDAIRDASQRFADAQYNLQRALEAVGDAQHAVVEANEELRKSYKGVRDATENLRDAKIQAARDIVDANLEERDAALSLAEAELGVLEAKQRLREEEKKAKGADDIEGARAALREAQERLKIAKAEGDESEISLAQHQLTIAQQNLNSILDTTESAKLELKDAQLGVKRAELTLEQARVRNSRARTDAQQARKDGIQGAEIVKTAQEQLKSAIESVSDSQRSVVLANRNVRDSLHQVAVAQREVAEARDEEREARKGQTQADKDAQAAFADLAPAEKKLFRSLQRLRDTFKKVFVGTSERDGILGPITESIARFADTLTKLLLDPEIQKAAGTLAQAIADALDEFRKFVGSAEFKEALLFFTKEAADNIPRVVEGMLNLSRSFLDIAKAATPLFNRLLQGAVGLTARFKGITSQGGETRRREEGGVGAGFATINESGLDKFLASAERHLGSWLTLSGAIIDLIAAITTSPASGSGATLIEALTDQIERLTNFIRENPQAVRQFFEDAEESIENLAKILGRLAGVLIKSFSSEEFQAFAQVIAEIVIPGLIGLIFFLGKLSEILLFILKIPVVGDIVKFGLAFLVFEKSLNKLFPVTQKITQGIKALAGAAFRAARVLLAPGGLRAAFDTIAFEARKMGQRVQRAATNLLDFGKRAATAAVRGATAVKDAFVAMGRAALTAAANVGRTLYAAMLSFSKLIAGAVVNALRLLRLNIRLLVASTGIGALIVAGLLLIENWDKVKAAATQLWKWIVAAFKRVTDWLRNNWKKAIVALLLAPFLIGGAVLIGLYKFRDKILGVFTTIKNGIIGAFKSAFDWIREKFTDIVDWMQKQYDKLPGPVKAIIRGAGKVAEGAAKIGGAIGGARDRLPFASGGTVPGLAVGATDSVPAMLTPGEWVLNRRQQSLLAARLGTTIAQAKAMIFGTKSNVPPGQRPRNNRLGKQITQYGTFNLVSQEDPDGVTVWFIEMADGAFGQVTSRDAAKIQKSNGTWIPNYVKRSTHGFTQSLGRVVTGGISGFSMGGIVPNAGTIQRFAEGGIVQAPGHGGTSRGGNTINQNFDVKTQGETDWGYVMRLGAIHAQSSF